MSRAVALGLLVASLAGCGVVQDALRSGEPILRAYRVPDDPRALIVEFSGCEPEPPRQIEESDESVTVALAGPNGGCEPLHHLTFELDVPLGDRSVVDGSRGEAVPVDDLPQD